MSIDNNHCLNFIHSTKMINLKLVSCVNMFDILQSPFVTSKSCFCCEMCLHSPIFIYFLVKLTLFHDNISGFFSTKRSTKKVNDWFF